MTFSLGVPIQVLFVASVAGVSLVACSSPDNSPEAKAVAYVNAELGVEGSALTDTRKGGECLVAEVEAPDGERYRVIMVAQLPDPEDPYDVFGMSQEYELDDFIGDSDVVCGIAHMDAYGQDENGDWVIFR